MMTTPITPNGASHPRHATRQEQINALRRRAQELLDRPDVNLRALDEVLATIRELRRAEDSESAQRHGPS